MGGAVAPRSCPDPDSGGLRARSLVGACPGLEAAGPNSGMAEISRRFGPCDTMGVKAKIDGDALPIAAAEDLTTDRLALTPLSVNDAYEVHLLLADPELYQFTGGAAPTLENLERRFIMQCADSPEPGVAWRNWIIRLHEDGRAVGFVQATVTGHQAAVAWLTGVPWQGQGIASEATTAMCTWLTTQGIERLVAHIHPDHRASAKVARAAGLTRTAELDPDGKRLWASTS